MLKHLSIAALPLALLACVANGPDDGGMPSTTGDDTPGEPGTPTLTDEQYQDAAVRTMHDALLADVEEMRLAAIDIQHAAPTPADRGWDAEKDAAAIAAMRKAWVRGRTAYEHIEGALAPLFPDIDNSIDARYDDFMTQLEAQGGDSDLFDDEGVTGMHAVERIIYSDVAPPGVAMFEASLPGYRPAAFPATPEEAMEFMTKLCEKLIADVGMLEAQWTPTNINVAIAFQGLIQLVQEQREKVQKAASNEEESRYSQRTMADLRDNLEGSKAVYGMFRSWITSRDGGDAIDRQARAGFVALDAAYAKVTGDAIPAPPSTWSAESPSTEDLASPFGQLYTAVQGAVNPAIAESLTAQLNDAASLLGFPSFGDGQ
jgi:iron uptake system component EfeO